MPICKECKWFDKETSDCHGPQYSRNITIIRRCIFGAIVDNLDMMNGNVLEIGYGKVFFLRKKIKSRKCIWHGIEPRWPGKKDGSNKFEGTVSKMPFENEFFDCVYCSQSMEHWGEFGDAIESGLNEIHRVLKPSGLLLVDVPIHSHGFDVFIKGNTEEIKYLFKNSKWEIVKFDERRKIYDPLLPIKVENKYHKYTIENSGQMEPSVGLLNMVMKKI